MLLIGLHAIPESGSFHGGIVTELVAPQAVLNAMGSATPVLTFRDFSLRCDKSDPQISFQTPWNWELVRGKKVAVITNNTFLQYQLIAGLAGLVPPVSGEIICDGAMGWPVGGEGGLDGKLRISHALSFLSTLYSDCLEKSHVSIDEFWDLLSGMEIHPKLLIKELSKSQKSFFYLALSVLFSFDCYLITKSSSYTLMSSAAKPLRALFRKQIEGKAIIATSTSGRFRREFCTEGLVLGSFGQILFAGELAEAVEWADQNLKASEGSDSDDDQFEMGLDLRNVDSYDGSDDDF